MSTIVNDPSVNAKPTTEDIKVFRRVFYSDNPSVTDQEIVTDIEKCFSLSSRMIEEAKKVTGCSYPNVE